MNYIFILLIFMPSLALGATNPGDFLSGHEKGWFWYEKPPITLKNKQKEHTPQAFHAPKSMEEVQASLKKLKEIAIMNPTDANLAAYIRLQNWVSERSQLFANVWQQTLRNHPDLDYSIAHPTNAQAVIVQREEQRKQSIEILQQIGQSYGLFFIFRSDCPYCHKEAPMLKRFGQHYGISIIPISQDGIGLADFPNPEKDTVSSQFGIKAVPALFLVNPKKHLVIPVSFGLISEDDLIARLILIIHKIREKPIQ